MRGQDLPVYVAYRVHIMVHYQSVETTALAASSDLCSLLLEITLPIYMQHDVHHRMYREYSVVVGRVLLRVSSLHSFRIHLIA